MSYWTVGTTVVDACVRHQTDYVDTYVDTKLYLRFQANNSSSGDIPLIHSWIKKYHETAEASGVAVSQLFLDFRNHDDIVLTTLQLIHACGVFAGPEDLLSWAAARELRDSFDGSTKEVVLAVKELT